MSEETSITESPEEIVSKQITTALEVAGLLLAERSERLQASLATGQVKSEDWYHEVDVATAPEEGNDEQ